MIDNFKHQGLRRNLIQVLREKGKGNEKVLEAMLNIPRHLFISSAFLEYAYQNKAFPIAAEQTISLPETVAVQSTLLDVQPKDKVLEIGTGSGYQTSVLCELGATVFSIERQKELYTSTKPLLKKLGYKAKLYYGDGFKGIPVDAPFDKIIITCGAPFVPQELLKQLKVGGIMIIPVGEGDEQKMLEIRRLSQTEFTNKEHGKFRFVPMLEQKAK